MPNQIFLLLFLLSAAALPLGANNISVQNISLTGGSVAEGYTYVAFDLSWENSWRLSSGAANWDAAWVFVKYRVGAGAWQHAWLHNDGHITGTGTSSKIRTGLLNDKIAFNPTTNPGMGAFVYRDVAGTGTFASTGVKLRWNYAANGLPTGANVDVKVFAIEMVHVPEGSFWLGDGGSAGSFRQSGNSNPYQVTTTGATIKSNGTGCCDDPQLEGSGIWVDGDGGISKTSQGPTDINPEFPTGYKGFYCMKYEVTQQQYVDFLNTLTQPQANTRKYTDSGYRYAITGSAVGSYATTNPYVGCNYLSWADGAAYADWSGLRPLTELEYEKACRGPLSAVNGEYAWGTSSITTNAYTLSNAGGANEGISSGYSTNATAGNASYDATTPFGGSINGPLRVGIFSGHPSNNGSRVRTGGTYWGIMEMSGNLWERCVTIGGPEGRNYTGLHGDGNLNSTGDANALNWPGTNALGAGFRGGFWYVSASYLRVSGRSLAASTYSLRYFDLGFRASRGEPVAGGE